MQKYDFLVAAKNLPSFFKRKHTANCFQIPAIMVERARRIMRTTSRVLVRRFIMESDATNSSVINSAIITCADRAESVLLEANHAASTAIAKADRVVG